MSATTVPKSKNRSEWTYRTAECPGVESTMFVEEFPKGLTSRVCYALYHGVQCHLRSTDGPHAVMYSPWSETPLNDLPRVSEGRECTIRWHGPRILGPNRVLSYPRARGHFRI